MPGPVLLHGGDASDRILDRAVAGAAAEVPLQIEGEILLRLLGEARRRHDHPRGAEAALERLGVEERLPHRVRLAVAGEALERGDLAALGPERGDQATVDGLAIEPDRTRAAVARVAPLLHPEPADVTQERPQALAGSRLRRERLAVDAIAHVGVP